MFGLLALLVVASVHCIASTEIGNGILTSDYNPETDNIYYLYTRENSSGNQTLIKGNYSQVNATTYDATRRTAFTIHGYNNSVTSNMNLKLVPALLAGENLNVIVVDWSAGAKYINYAIALQNAIKSAPAVADFMSWLINATGTDLSKFMIVGHSLGAHEAGLIGRKFRGQLSYIIGCDPAGPGFVGNSNRLRANDSMYTEVIHTNGGELGYEQPCGHTDFYVNRGSHQPGCDLDSRCDHGRSFEYIAESFISGGFTAMECSSFTLAVLGNCTLQGSTATLQMGGLIPKTGSTGIYYLKTNPKPQYSIS